MPTCYCPSPSLLEDATKHGTISLSCHGSRYSIGFRGAPDFIQRMLNMCFNRGMVSVFSRPHYPYGTESFVYLAVDTKERVLRALASQFRSEMVMNEEVKPLVKNWWEGDGEEWKDKESCKLQFDEASLDARARNRAEWFLANVVKIDHFMTRLARELAYVPAEYSRGTAEETAEE